MEGRESGIRYGSDAFENYTELNLEVVFIIANLVHCLPIN